jgi:hypothetical protein
LSDAAETDISFVNGNLFSSLSTSEKIEPVRKGFLHELSYRDDFGTLVEVNFDSYVFFFRRTEGV